MLSTPLHHHLIILEAVHHEWQQESPYKEELELVKHNRDLCFKGLSVRRAYHAGKSGDWGRYLQEFRKDDKLSEWASMKVKASYEKVEAVDIGRLSSAQDMLRKSSDVQRRIIAPNDGSGGVTLSYVCPHCHCFPLEDNIWWVSSGHSDGNRKKKEAVQLVVCSLWRPVRVEGPEQGLGHTRPHGPPRNTSVSSARFAALQGMCDNLINQQKVGDSPVGIVVTGLLERSRSRVMDGLRKFTTVDNHEAVKVGDLHRETRSKKVVMPRITTDFPGAVFREGMDVRTSVDTSKVGDQRWEPPGS